LVTAAGLLSESVTGMPPTAIGMVHRRRYGEAPNSETVLMEFLKWLGDTPVAHWVSDNMIVYYGLLAGHAIGMGVVVGFVYMLSARVLGFGRDIPLVTFAPLYRLVWASFGLNFATGILLFSANPRNLVENTPFLLKLTFIGLGGVSLWALNRSLEAEPAPVSAGGTTASARSRTLALTTALVWTAAIVSGRIIAYTVKYI
jgi:hypothetical protein